MQLIAEAYDLLRTGLGARARPRSPTSSGSWNDGDLESFLIEITADVLGHTDAATGQAVRRRRRWTRPSRRAPAAGPCRAPSTSGVPITGIAEATFARSLSGHADQRAAARAGVRADAGATLARRRPRRVRRGRARARCTPRKIVAYAQGFDQIARRQRGVRLGHRPRRDGDHLARRLHHPGPVPRPDPRGVRRASPTCPRCWSRRTSPTRSPTACRRWRRVVADAARAGVPTPAFSSSLAYFDALRRDRLPAALIQGLRDNFGAHTYQRVDREGTFHTDGPATAPKCRRERRSGAARWRASPRPGSRPARSAVTRCPPVTGEPRRVAVAQRAGALQLDRAAGTKRCTNGASGRSTSSPGASRAACSAAYPLLIRIADAPSCSVHAGRDRHQAAAQQLVVDLQLLVAGLDARLVRQHPHLHEVHRVACAASPPVSRQASFFSECRMPVPALIRWARPG